MKIRIAGTVNDSIVDGKGIRFTVFVQGCPHRCKNCHNPQTHDFTGGTETDTSELLAKIKANPLLDGVTFSGGEPFCHGEALAALGRDVKALGLDIVTYTGYTFEELMAGLNEHKDWAMLLEVTDVLIDGRFEESLKSYDVAFRGSTNQRYLDCQQSLKAGQPIEMV